MEEKEVCFAALEGVFRAHRRPAKRLVGLVTRIAAKAVVYTYGSYVNSHLGRSQGRIKELGGKNVRQTSSDTRLSRSSKEQG